MWVTLKSESELSIVYTLKMPEKLANTIAGCLSILPKVRCLSSNYYCGNDSSQRCFNLKSDIYQIYNSLHRTIQPNFISTLKKLIE